MYGTSIDGDTIRERNAQVLREVRAARLEGRLKQGQESGGSVPGGLRLTIQRIRLALFGRTSVEQTTTA